MAEVLLNSLLLIGALAVACVLLVRGRNGSFPSLKSLFPATVAREQDAGIRIHQRLFLGWKSSLVDVGWQGRRYLLHIQDGRCTVIDRSASEPSAEADDHE